MARDEDDRHLMPFHRNTPLQFEAVESGKRNVQNQAAWHGCAWTAEKFLRGNECFYTQAFMAKQKLQRFTNGDVVIDDEDDWMGLASWGRPSPLIHVHSQDSL